MANIDLSQYGITGTTEIVYNPSYELLFKEETDSSLEGFEKGQESELGAVNVMIRFGGHQMNTKTTIIRQARKHGIHVRRSR